MSFKSGSLFKGFAGSAHLSSGEKRLFLVWIIAKYLCRKYDISRDHSFHPYCCTHEQDHPRIEVADDSTGLNSDSGGYTINLGQPNSPLSLLRGEHALLIHCIQMSCLLNIAHLGACRPV